MHDIWPLKVIHNDSIESLHYHFSKACNDDKKSTRNIFQRPKINISIIRKLFTRSFKHLFFHYQYSDKLL